MNKIIFTIIGAFIMSSLVSPIYISEVDAETYYNYQLAEWINKLSFAESTNRENIVIVDSNGKNSYGCLQFQKATFVAYSKKHKIKGDIMSCKTQKELAMSMIKENHNNWRHWFNSTKKIGKPPVYKETA